MVWEPFHFGAFDNHRSSWEYFKRQCFKKASTFLIHFEHSKISFKIYMDKYSIKKLNSNFLLLSFDLYWWTMYFKTNRMKIKNNEVKVFDFLVDCLIVLAISLKSLCLKGISITIRNFPFLLNAKTRLCSSWFFMFHTLSSELSGGSLSHHWGKLFGVYRRIYFF